MEKTLVLIPERVAFFIRNKQTGVSSRERRRRGIVIARGVQTIEPTVTSEEESELLGIPLYSPAFLFERTTEGQEGEVVEFVRSVYRGDRYRLVTELRPALR